MAEITEKTSADRSRPASQTADVTKETQTDRVSSTPASDSNGNVEDAAPRESVYVRWFKAALPILFPLVLLCGFVIFLELFIQSTTNKYRHLGWIVPFLLWLATTGRFLAIYPFTRKYLGRGLRAIFGAIGKAGNAGVSALPAVVQKSLNLVLFACTVIIVFVATYASVESEGNSRADRSISLLGFIVFVGIFWATSRNHAKINFQAVWGGISAQFLLGIFVLKTKAGYDIFNFIGTMAKKLLGMSDKGTAFLTTDTVPTLGWFLVTVVPAVTFFVAFVYLLHHWGWIGWMVNHFATVFTRLLDISGAEAVVAAASPFIGQGESAILVREYVGRMTDAEIHQVMTSGFATIAGSVMSAYINMGISPVAIISSCVMSIPGSIALSKLRYPETGVPVTGRKGLEAQADVDMEEARALNDGQPGDDTGDHQHERAYNALHAFSTGAGVGLSIAALIVANVLCILALLGLANGLLGWWGNYHGVDEFSIEMIMGYLLYPLAFLLGVDIHNNGGGDIRKVAQLLGVKIVANEFVAFADLTSEDYASLATRSKFIAMYALCGFGNFSAVGIQIGVLTQLAPRRGGDIAKVAVSALITGIVSTLTSATIAGMLMTGDELITVAV